MKTGEAAVRWIETVQERNEIVDKPEFTDCWTNNSCLIGEIDGIGHNGYEYDGVGHLPVQPYLAGQKRKKSPDNEDEE